MTGIIFYVPEALAVTPTEGHAYVNRWWTVHPDKGVAFHCTRRRSFDLEPGEQDEPSPQCNSNEFTARALTQRIYPDCDVKLLPVVFVGHAIKEMHRVRAEARAAMTSQERQP
jgi:hypothetical protein